jgi:hypothetical protein
MDTTSNRLGQAHVLARQWSRTVELAELTMGMGDRMGVLHVL